MKKIIYILLFFSCSLFGQHQTMLLVSQEQFRNETPTVIELYDWSDSGSPSATGDANSIYVYDTTKGWDDRSSVVLSVESSDVNDGSYSIKILNSTTSTRYCYLYIDGMTIGKTYDISFDSKRVGEYCGIRPNSGFPTPSYASIGTTWGTYGWDGLVANATTARIYIVLDYAAVVDEYVLIDNFSLTQID